jgi:hypothetical protein
MEQIEKESDSARDREKKKKNDDITLATTNVFFIEENDLD